MWEQREIEKADGRRHKRGGSTKGWEEGRGQKKRILGFYAVTKRGIRVTRCCPGCGPVPRPHQLCTPEGRLPSATTRGCGCGQFCLQQGGRQVRGESGSQPSGLPTACTPAPQRRERAGVAALTARVVATPGPLAAGRESPHAAASAPGGGGAARASTFPAFPAARGKFTGRRRWPQP